MRYNGLCLVVKQAVARVGDPMLTPYRDTLLLGALREDYWHVPLTRLVFESPSLEHFYGPPWPGGFIPLLTPGAPAKAAWLYRRALAAARAGQAARACVQLGRCAHLLIDMACPAHVRRVAHLNDPYEWFVEAHADALAREPVPAEPPAGTVRALVKNLSAHTSRCEADGVNSVHGRWLRRLGLRRPLPRDIVAAQAHTLIPLAISHCAALFRLYLRESRHG